MDKTILAYAARLMDGEGSITLIRTNKGGQIAPYLTMTSTSIELVQFMKDHFGGSACIAHKAKDKYSEAYHWKIGRKGALKALTLIAPYLREKEKVRRARLSLNHYPELLPRNGHYTPEILEKIHQVEQEFFKYSSKVKILKKAEDEGIEPLQLSTVPQVSSLVAVHSAASSELNNGS